MENLAEVVLLASLALNVIMVGLLVHQTRRANADRDAAALSFYAERAFWIDRIENPPKPMKLVNCIAYENTP